MRRLVVLLPVLLISLALTGPALAGGKPFTVPLTGAAEVPFLGDPDGSGEARLTLNQGQGEICFWISVRDIALPATGAHIHRAPAGSAARSWCL